MFWKVLRYASQHDSAVWGFLEAYIYNLQLLITLSQNKNIYNSTLSFVKKALIETFFVFEPKSLKQTA